MTEPSMGDVFRRAAEILRERGHCKGQAVDEQGRVCTIGALSYASAGDHDLALIRTAAAEMTGAPVYSVAQWNDAPERTQVEVEKLFLLAADRADFGS